MARHMFGGGIADWTFARVDGVDGQDGLAQLVSAVVTLWNLPAGGTQITDLLDSTGAPITQVISSDGSGVDALGQIPQFQGPEDVWTLWASADGGPRALMTATDAAEFLSARIDALEA